MSEPALRLLRSLRGEDGRTWGEKALPFQVEAASAVLLDRDVPYSFWTRPRGGSKTYDVAAICIALMLVEAPPEARLYVVAADRDQGRLVIDSIREFRTNTPGLDQLLQIHNFAVRVTGTNTVLEVMAADAPSAWGLRPYFIAVDEIAQWRETSESKLLYEAIRTAVGKRLGRMVVCTTPGDPEHFAREIRDHAAIDPLWNLFEVPGPVPWQSRERLAEQQRSLTRSRFARLHLGQWAEPENRLAAAADLRACVRSEPTRGPNARIDYVIGVDVGLTNDHTAAAVCHTEDRKQGHGGSERTVVVDTIATWQGSHDHPVDLSEVEEWLASTARSYNDALVVLDPWQTAQMSQNLFRRDTRTEDVSLSTRKITEIATTVHILIREHRLELPDEEQLLHELARVELREPRPGSLRLEHREGDHDDQTFAIGLAATRLLDRRGTAAPRLRVLQAPDPPLPLLGRRW